MKKRCVFRGMPSIILCDILHVFFQSNSFNTKQIPQLLTIVMGIDVVDLNFS